MIREIRLCDMCLTGTKPREVTASTTRKFSNAGDNYEIDLCGKHASAMEKTFSVFVAHSRRVRRTGVTSPTSHIAPKRDRDRSRAIRIWAGQHGYTVNSHGRIPEHVMKAYDDDVSEHISSPRNALARTG